MPNPHTTIADDVIGLEEFQRMPEEDEYRIELVRGRIVREPRPGAQHGALTGELVHRLSTHVRDRAMGLVVTETGFLLAVDPPTVRGPDLAFIAAEHLPPARFRRRSWSTSHAVPVRCGS